jgi:hypothetical protein
MESPHEIVRALSILTLPRAAHHAAHVTELHRGRAQAFLQSIYLYEKSDKAVDIGSETKATRYFVPSVANLIGCDIAESKKKNEVGRLDFDPFIGGQDWSPTKIEAQH